MLLANFNRKEHLRHRAVSLRQHGFLVGIRSNISLKLLELETSNLIHGFVWTMPSKRINNFPESRRGLGHVTLTIFGSTVGYPSDSLASCCLPYPPFRSSPILTKLTFEFSEDLFLRIPEGKDYTFTLLICEITFRLSQCMWSRSEFTNATGGQTDDFPVPWQPRSEAMR